MSRSKLSIRDVATFAMLGALIFIGDIAFEWAMNIEPVTMLVMTYTVVYGLKGLIPFSVYITLQMLFFPGWYIVPYLYIFPLCAFCTVLVPKNISFKARQALYTLICTLFGLLFGTFYAPWQMFLMGSHNLLAWIISGLPADALHAAGNFAASFLIIPLSAIINKIKKTA